jgi:hypothetical protein
MNNLVEQMIQIVESNAVDNKAVIPDVESWAIAWREESNKQKCVTSEYDFNQVMEMAKIIGSYSGLVKSLLIDIGLQLKSGALDEKEFLRDLEKMCSKTLDTQTAKWDNIFN